MARRVPWPRTDTPVFDHNTGRRRYTERGRRMGRRLRMVVKCILIVGDEVTSWDAYCKTANDFDCLLKSHERCIVNAALRPTTIIVQKIQKRCISSRQS